MGSTSLGDFYFVVDVCEKLNTVNLCQFCFSSKNISFQFLVPTWTPGGIAAWNTSSTSILLSWQPLADLYYLHGNLAGYTVTYSRLDGLLSTKQTNLCSSNLSVELTGLDEYVEYRIEVRAFTVKGSGPYTYINCSTEQDGKRILFSERCNFLHVTELKGTMTPRFCSFLVKTVIIL